MLSRCVSGNPSPVLRVRRPRCAGMGSTRTLLFVGWHAGTKERGSPGATPEYFGENGRRNDGGGLCAGSFYREGPASS